MSWDELDVFVVVVECDGGWFDVVVYNVVYFLLMLFE